MKIFVTGATGFLGKHLCRALTGNIYEVGSKECDLTKPHSLHRFDAVVFDRIYHLAAWTQAGDFCLTHGGEQWLINQQINTNLLTWWKEKQPQAQLICIGSSCGYDPTLPLTEKYYLSGKPTESLFAYAMTKRMLLAGLQALHDQFGLSYLYVIPATLYGPDYPMEGKQLHFIFDVIQKILRGLYFDEPVILWGDGYQQRELIHVDDFITCTLTLAEKTCNDHYNIGTGVGFTINELASSICSAVGYSYTKIQHDLQKYVGARSKILNIEKIQKLLPAFKPTQWHAKMDDTIQWCAQQMQKLKQNGSTHKCERALG